MTPLARLGGDWWESENGLWKEAPGVLCGFALTEVERWPRSRLHIEIRRSRYPALLATYGSYRTKLGEFCNWFAFDDFPIFFSSVIAHHSERLISEFEGRAVLVSALDSDKEENALDIEQLTA